MQMKQLKWQQHQPNQQQQQQKTNALESSVVFGPNFSPTSEKTPQKDAQIVVEKKNEPGARRKTTIRTYKAPKDT